MEIKTKFNLRQKVYFMWDNKVQSLQIDSISVKAIALGGGEEEIEISYKLCGLTDSFDEKNMFATKEELLKSL